jgi:hypothetical protein
MVGARGFEPPTLRPSWTDSLYTIHLFLRCWARCTCWRGSPDIGTVECSALARRFHFAESVLPVVAGPEVRSVRPVHKSLQHISTWISGVGAGVALNDFDGDGLPNDICYVDVRTDQVIVPPAPGTGARYQTSALDAGPLYRRETMAPMGCLPGDMNEDGRMDLLVYYWGRTPVAFLHDGAAMNAAAFRPFEIVPGGERWYTKRGHIRRPRWRRTSRPRDRQLLRRRRANSGRERRRHGA